MVPVEHHVPRLGGGSVGPHLEEAFRAAALERAEEAEDPDLADLLGLAFDLRCAPTRASSRSRRFAPRRARG